MVYEAKNKFPAMRGRGSKIIDLYGKKIKKINRYEIAEHLNFKNTSAA
jgi:hypothetical protein